MLCCLDASVQSDDEYSARKKSSKRSKKKKTFKEVQLSVDDAYKHMNGRIPADEEKSIHSSETAEAEAEKALAAAKAEHEKNLTQFEMDVLKHQVQLLQQERDDYQNRLSRYASSSLTDNNPSIVDLSDPNRPDILAQRIAELYDNQWTDAYIYLTDMGMTEKAAIGILSENFRTIYRVCKTLATQQMSAMGAQIGFFTGFDHIPDHFMAHVKMYKDERKKNYRKFLPALEKKTRKYAKTVKGLGDYFIVEGIEICWLMCIQDPPMALDFACYPGDVFDTKTFRPFTSTGSHVDYLVWPGLRLYENGPLLCKGFAQGRKSLPNTSQKVTRRLTEQHKAEPKVDDPSSMYRRRDTSAQLSRISESSQEYQPSFISSEYSKSTSERFYSNYDSQSQMSRSSSIQDISGRPNEHGIFLKNADFRTATQTGLYTSEQNHDSTIQDRFVIPGRHRQYHEESTTKEYESNNIHISMEQEEFHKQIKDENDNFINDHKRFIEEETAKHVNQSEPNYHLKLSEHTVQTPPNSRNASRQLQSNSPFERNSHSDNGDQNNRHKRRKSSRQTHSSTPIEYDSYSNEEHDNSRSIGLNTSGQRPSRSQLEREPWQEFFDEADETRQSAKYGQQHPSEADIGFDQTSKSGTDKRDRDIVTELIMTTPSFTSASKTPPVIESPPQEHPPDVHIKKHIHFSPGVSPTKAQPHGITPVSKSPSQDNSIVSAKMNTANTVHEQDNITPSGSLAPKKSLKKISKKPSEKNTSNLQQKQSVNAISYRGTISKDQVRTVESPVRFLTVKINKIQRMPKRRYLEEEEATSKTTETLSGKHSSKNTNMPLDYTPRNVPSVENVTHRSNIDTGRLSKTTPRRTHATETPGKGRHSELKADKHTTRLVTDIPEKVRHGENSKESHASALGTASQLSDQGYISQVVSDYSPRKQHPLPAVPVIKQYPAFKPDFTNTIRIRPDSPKHGAYLLTPKPAPKLAGSLAARLRFVID